MRASHRSRILRFFCALETGAGEVAATLTGQFLCVLKRDEGWRATRIRQHHGSEGWPRLYRQGLAMVMRALLARPGPDVNISLDIM
jgi:hypothetical protein